MVTFFKGEDWTRAQVNTKGDCNCTHKAVSDEIESAEAYVYSHV
jgi:hypothetical protein